MTSQTFPLLVAIDIGNSHVSAALFALNEVGEPTLPGLDVPLQIRCSHQEFPTVQWQSTVQQWAAQGVLRWFVSSVHRPARESLVEWLTGQRPEENFQVLRSFF